MKRRDAQNGDRGQTALADGARVSKGSARIAALGGVDELNAALGVARCACGEAAARELLASLQRDLLALGAQLASPATGKRPSGEKASWSAARLARIEAVIDAVETRLPALAAFVLPGGSAAGAALQWARAVCRRAERSVVALAGQEDVDPLALAYLNRLSDLLFALARGENQRQGIVDEVW
jgi:cob(I)alamin adenosyltransferase